MPGTKLNFRDYEYAEKSLLRCVFSSCHKECTELIECKTPFCSNSWEYVR